MRRGEALIIMMVIMSLAASLGQTCLMGLWRVMREARK